MDQDSATTNAMPAYGGLWVRVLAFAIDYVAIALYLILLTILGLFVTTLSPSVTRMLFGDPVSGQITGFLAITLPVTLYFALSESSTRQATLGKQRMKLKVVRTDGVRLGRARSLARTLLKFVPWELSHACIWHLSFATSAPSPLISGGFALVWLLVGANLLSLVRSATHQTLYDQIIGTVVVKRPTPSPNSPGP